MALGAFLAGVLLAESEYRRELETDLEPFKGLLLGPVLHRRGHEHRLRGGAGSSRWLVAAVVLGFLLLKALVLWAHGARDAAAAGRSGRCSSSCSRRAASSASSCSRPRRRRGVIDAPTLVAAGRGGGAVDAADAAAAGGRRPLVAPRAGQRAAGAASWPRSASRSSAPIIIAGFGRYGQIVGRLLYANGLQRHRARPRRRAGRGACAASAGRCSTATRRGSTCCAPPAPAQRARARAGDRRRRAEPEGRRAGARALPAAARSSRARATCTHYYGLRELGVTLIERETLDSALMSARSVLELMGWEPHQARNAGAALSPPQHRAAGADGAAPRRRGAS